MNSEKVEFVKDVDLCIKLTESDGKIILHLMYDNNAMMDSITLDNKPNIWAVVELLNTMNSSDLDIRRKIVNFIHRCCNGNTLVSVSMIDAYQYNLDFMLRSLSTRYLVDNELWEITIPVTMRYVELIDDIPTIFFDQIDIPNDAYEDESDCLKTFEMHSQSDYFNNYFITRAIPKHGEDLVIGSNVKPSTEALTRLILASRKDIRLERVFIESVYIVGIKNMMTMLVSIMNINMCNKYANLE